ncbi:MAG: hypothetical protein Kow0068_04140 [Marinilabiliales bacterium]
MKNLPLILSIVAIIATGILYGVYFSTPSSVAESNEINIDDSSATNTKTYEMAYVKIDSLLLNYKFYSELESKIMKRQQSMEAELKRQYAAFEKELADFQYKMQNNLFLSQESYSSQEQALYAKRDQLMAKEQELSDKLTSEQAALNKQLLDTVLNFMKLFNADKRYRFIIDAKSLLYGEKGDDITDTVLTLLNQRYEKFSNTDSTALN